MPQKKNQTVLLAKSIGIILVVAGHFHPKNSPGYWLALREAIYTFHMPLFFFISGYLLSYTKADLSSYKSFISKKFRRLAVPFVSIVLLMAAVRYIIGQFIQLDYPVTIERIVWIFINPLENSYYPLLWFIYVLFLTFLVFPLLIRVIHNPYLLLFISVIFMLFNWPGYLCLNQFARMFPLFIIGYIAGNKIELDTIGFKANLAGTVVSASAFAVLLFHMNTFPEDHFAYKLIMFLLGITGTLGVIGISGLMNRLKAAWTGWFMRLGVYTMSIYIFHPLAESTVRVLIFRIYKADVAWFEAAALIAITAGILMPILLEAYLLKKSKITQNIFWGWKEVKVKAKVKEETIDLKC